MATEQTREILQRGIAAAKAGQTATARQLLQSVIRSEPTNESAWLWLSTVAENDKERVFCLKKLLEINPNNENARKGLERLGLSPSGEPLSQVSTPPAEPPPPSQVRKTGQLQILPSSGKTGQLAPTDRPGPGGKTGPLSGQIKRLPSQQGQPPSSGGTPTIQPLAQPPSGETPTPTQPPSSGRVVTPLPTQPPSSGSIPTGPQPPVPVANEQRLTAAMSQLDGILGSYQPLPLPSLPFEWTKKTRGRVGEGSANSYRLRVGGIIAAVIIVALGIIYAIGRSSGAGGIFAAFAPPPPTLVPTLTFTPTATLTPMFGITSTPTPTSASAVIPTRLPPLTPGIGLGYRTATPSYPEIQDRPVREAVALMNVGQVQDAINVMTPLVDNLATNRDDRYYVLLFYYTKALVMAKQADAALDRLTKEPTTRPPDSEKYYRAALAIAQYAKGNATEALNEANRARAADPKLVDAVIIAARVFEDRGTASDLNSAETTLLNALNAQPGSALLLTELARVQLMNNKLDDALRNVLNALYIDPLNYDAFAVRGDILLQRAANQSDKERRLQAYSDAVIASLEFRALYQDRTLVHYQLGRAYQGEGKINEALYSYEQATIVDKTSPEAQRVYLVRGQLYLDQHKFTEAQADFEAANRISTTDEGLSGRLSAALGAGDYSAALDTLDEVRKRSGSINSTLTVREFDLMARAYAAAMSTPDSARSKDVISRFKALGGTIDEALLSSLSSEDQVTVRLFRGIWYFDKGTYERALDDFVYVLGRRDSILGHYFRGKTYQALSQVANAVHDYEWVVFWSNVYGFDLSGDANDQLAELQAKLPKPTATLSPTFTRTPIVTPTPTDTRTPTATRTPSPTRTPRFSPTPTETPTSEETLTPTPTDTDTPSGDSTITPTPGGNSE